MIYRIHVFMHLCVSVCVCLYIFVYMYVYSERERTSKYNLVQVKKSVRYHTCSPALHAVECVRISSPLPRRGQEVSLRWGLWLCVNLCLFVCVCECECECESMLLCVCAFAFGCVCVCVN